MPYYRHDPQEQYVVNFNWIKGKHNVRFGGDIYHQALNQTQAEFITGGFGAQGGFGFDRGITERCEVINPETGNCEQPPSGSRYNSVAAFLIGQASSAGRTLQVPDEYHVNARLYSTYIRDRWTPGDKLTIDFGTRFEYFPVPTRPDRGIEFYDVDTGKVLLCGVGHSEGLRDRPRRGAVRSAGRAGVSIQRQVGRPRRLWIVERSVLRDGAHSSKLSAPGPEQARVPGRL